MPKTDSPTACDAAFTAWVRVGIGRWNEVIPARSGSYAQSLNTALDSLRGMSCDILVTEVKKGNPNDDRRM